MKVTIKRMISIIRRIYVWIMFQIRMSDRTEREYDVDADIEIEANLT